MRRSSVPGPPLPSSVPGPPLPSSVVDVTVSPVPEHSPPQQRDSASNHGPLGVSSPQQEEEPAAVDPAVYHCLSCGTPFQNEDELIIQHCHCSGDNQLLGAASNVVIFHCLIYYRLYKYCLLVRLNSSHPKKLSHAFSAIVPSAPRTSCCSISTIATLISSESTYTGFI